MAKTIKKHELDAKNRQIKSAKEDSRHVEIVQAIAANAPKPVDLTPAIAPLVEGIKDLKKTFQDIKTPDNVNLEKQIDAGFKALNAKIDQLILAMKKPDYIEATGSFGQKIIARPGWDKPRGN